MYWETIIIIACLIIFLIELLAIYLLVGAAKAKGFHRNGAGVLWLVGILASPIVLGLYTASLPDRGKIQAPVAAPKQQLRDEMPQV